MTEQREQEREKCFACNRHIIADKQTAMTGDGQSVYVGPDCYRKIEQAGAAGYQPPLGGPRLFRKL